MPHLYCLRGDPGVLWLQVLSDLAIAVAYYAIPFVLMRVVLKRKEALFRRLAVLFVLFIAACGTTHVLEVWTIWHPMYRLPTPGCWRCARMGANFPSNLPSALWRPGMDGSS